MGKFMIIFPCQITAEQMGFSFEFSLGRIILHLAKLFKISKKKLKICVPSTPTEPILCISYHCFYYFQTPKHRR